MSKPWQLYAWHILDAIAKIRRIQSRGDLIRDEILYDAALRNLQTLAEATQQLPDHKKANCSAIPWREQPPTPSREGKSSSGLIRVPGALQFQRDLFSP